MATNEQLKAAVNATFAVAEAIREAREIPEGTLYAVVCAKLELSAFESIIRTLKNARLVESKFHMLRWIGPELAR